MNLRQMELVIYVDHLKVDIQETVKKYKTIKQWAYILHDKDDTGAHYHIYLNFGETNVKLDEVASWFKIPVQFVNKIEGRATDMLLYLTHGQKSQKHKYQYSPSEVVANFDVQTEISIAKMLGDFENHSYAQQLAYVNTLSVDIKARVFKKLNDLWKIHCQCLMLKPDRDIDVVFVTGAPGAGKTY